MKTSSRSTFSLPPEAEDSCFEVRTCFGLNAAGACHQVLLNPSHGTRHRYLDQQDEVIVVYLYLENAGARASFYQAGQTIRRCGSGTMAALHVLYRELGIPLARLATDAGELWVQSHGEYLGYANTHLMMRPALDRSFWCSLPDQPSHDCQLIGETDDYCLLELASAEALARASVDIDALTRGSSRALVLTARAEEGPFDYVFRYFAPQYGMAESAVTASVNIDLGRYWCDRLNLRYLLARQLSDAGAIFHVEVAEDRVWIFGQTRRL